MLIEIVWYCRNSFWYAKGDCWRPGCQDSRFLFDILLNLMKVQVLSSIYAVNHRFYFVLIFIIDHKCVHFCEFPCMQLTENTWSYKICFVPFLVCMVASTVIMMYKYCGRACGCDLSPYSVFLLCKVFFLFP